MILLSTSLFTALACVSSNEEILCDPIFDNLQVFDTIAIGQLSQASKEKYKKLKQHLQRERNNLLHSHLNSLIPVTQVEEGCIIESLSNEAVNVRHRAPVFQTFLREPTRRDFKFSNLVTPITILLVAVQPSGIRTGINDPFPSLQLNSITFSHQSRVGNLFVHIHLEQESGLYSIRVKTERAFRGRNNINIDHSRELSDVQQIKLLLTPNDTSHPRGRTQILNSFEIQCDDVSIGKFWLRPGIFDGMADALGNEAEDSEAENYRGHPSKKNYDIGVETRISPHDHIPVHISFSEA